MLYVIITQRGIFVTGQTSVYHIDVKMLYWRLASDKRMLYWRFASAKSMLYWRFASAKRMLYWRLAGDNYYEGRSFFLHFKGGKVSQKNLWSIYLWSVSHNLRYIQSFSIDDRVLLSISYAQYGKLNPFRIQIHPISHILSINIFYRAA